MTEPTMPKTPPIHAAKVEQRHRDAAARIYQGLRDHDYAKWVSEGTNATGHHDPYVQAFATFERDLRPDDVLRTILNEATAANDVIRLNRDGEGSGLVKVATALHRIKRLARASLNERNPKP